MLNNYPKLSGSQLDVIAASVMVDNIREQLHGEIAPCLPGEFLTAYIARDDRISDVLLDFAIEGCLNDAGQSEVVDALNGLLNDKCKALLIDRKDAWFADVENTDGMIYEIGRAYTRSGNPELITIKSEWFV